MKSSPNIALLGTDFLLSGGAEFLRNLANALLSIEAEHKIKLILLLPVRNKVGSLVDLRMILQQTVITSIKQKKLFWPKTEAIYNASVLDFFNNIDGKLKIVEFNEATGLIPTLHKIKTDVVLPSGSSLGQAFPFPWVGYLYDFQHKYFPEYFTNNERDARDTHFEKILEDAKAVIVNSRSVKDDIDKFYPDKSCKVFNLPFSAAPISSWLKDDALELLKNYNLPQRYFLISNQFWIHKSHLTAFKALAMLKNETNCTDLHIVCTGKMEDYRFPDHIKNMQKEISDLTIENKVHFLGHIPKNHQIAIMKRSLAVLQPTLFEGGPGGGAVYDAVSLGVPVILSDIPVNREISNEKNIFYFKAGSEDDLAYKIKEFLRLKIKRPLKQELILRGEQRKLLLGEALLEAANNAMQQF